MSTSAVITPQQIINLIVTAFTTGAGATAIAAFMTANYSGDALNIIVGEDTVNPPGQNECPFVEIYPSARVYDIGTAANQRKPTIELDFALFDDRRTTSGSVTTNTGSVNIIAFSEVLRGVLETSLSGANGDHFQECFENFICDAPLWRGGFSITLNYETGMNFEPIA